MTWVAAPAPCHLPMAQELELGKSASGIEAAGAAGAGALAATESTNVNPPDSFDVVTCRWHEANTSIPPQPKTLRTVEPQNAHADLAVDTHEFTFGNRLFGDSQRHGAPDGQLARHDVS